VSFRILTDAVVMDHVFVTECRVGRWLEPQLLLESWGRADEVTPISAYTLGQEALS
jgi:hypothetical protein